MGRRAKKHPLAEALLYPLEPAVRYALDVTADGRITTWNCMEEPMLFPRDTLAFYSWLTTWAAIGYAYACDCDIGCFHS